MGKTLDALNEVRGKIAAHEDALVVARERRDAVLTVAGKFPGALDTYRSGSLAAGLMNHPVTDGDCGLVLDRRVYPELGPDGDGVGPIEKVLDVRALLLEHLPGEYPAVTVETMKRGLLIEFHERLDEEQDPTVDCSASREATGTPSASARRPAWARLTSVGRSCSSRSTTPAVTPMRRPRSRVERPSGRRRRRTTVARRSGAGSLGHGNDVIAVLGEVAGPTRRRRPAGPVTNPGYPTLLKDARDEEGRPAGHSLRPREAARRGPVRGCRVLRSTIRRSERCIHQSRR